MEMLQALQWRLQFAEDILEASHPTLQLQGSGFECLDVIYVYNLIPNIWERPIAADEISNVNIVYLIDP